MILSILFVILNLIVTYPLNPEKRIQNSAEENLLWRQFLAGESTAFEKLMENYFRLLFHYGTKFSKDKEFIKDSIQDLFLYLWEHRQNLNSDADVKSYLMASLRRYMHRTKQNQLWVSDNQLDENNDNFDIEFSVEERYIEQESSLEISHRIQQHLDALPKRQKEVVYLKFFQELDRDQIAIVMDVAPQTVSNLLQMAFKQLKKHWMVEFLAIILLHIIA